MKNKLRPTDLVNKWVYAIVIIFCGFFIATIYNGNENLYIPFFLFSGSSLSLYPFGRDISLLPVKREEIYRINLIATKWSMGILALSLLLMLIVGKAIFGVESSYVNLICAAEMMFSFMTLALCSTALFWKIQIKNKLISFGTWFIISIAYLSVIVGVIEFLEACMENYINVHFIFAILGGICSVLLFIFVDKFIYRVNVKLIKSYDFIAGDGAGVFNLAKEYKKQIRLKEK